MLKEIDDLPKLYLKLGRINGMEHFSTYGTTS